MLIIREAQIGRFRGVRIQKFVDAMVGYIAREYPVHCAGMKKSAIREFIHRSIDAAMALRIDTEGAIGVFTELRLIYGENLERAPDREWARNILAHRRLPGHIKVEAVQTRLSERTGGCLLVAFPESPPPPPPRRTRRSRRSIVK